MDNTVNLSTERKTDKLVSIKEEVKTTMFANTIETMLQQYALAWSSEGDVDRLTSFMTDDIVYTSVPFQTTIQGKEALKQFDTTIFSGFSNIQFKIIALDIHPPTNDSGVTGVTMNWEFSGLHTGDFLGNPPTHSFVVLPGVGELKIRDLDTKIQQSTDTFDLNVLLQQIQAPVA